MLSSKQWNNKASDIKFVYLYSTIKMMHGPINLRFTSRIICDVASVAALCSEYTVCFSGVVHECFFNFLSRFRLFQLLPVRSYNSCPTFIFIFPSAFVTFLSADIVTSICMHLFSFFFFNYHLSPIFRNSAVCISSLHNIIIIIRIITCMQGV